MITLTDSFVEQLKKIRVQKDQPGLMLRIIVDGGGCQGFEYRFDTALTAKDDDHVFEKDGAAIVIDSISLPYLEGSEVDYAQELIGAAFKINNPNAASSCGCGTSFSVKD